jgi:hypothetical protein
MKIVTIDRSEITSENQLSSEQVWRRESSAKLELQNPFYKGRLKI